ncbi:MAG: hypothetical protein LBO21_09975 [Synergistaceae bacterium]|nr:hypothetical protein [Synergistaceae bacterium]
MERPVLVILAAGIGRRYGGLKQIEAVGANGELLIDYSIYDAVRAGFRKVIFIIKRDIADDFRDVVGDRLEKNVETELAWQELSQIPSGYRVPEGRTKPWGTAQALFSIKGMVNGPFAVINADDYYGPSAFKTIYDWLAIPWTHADKLRLAMVGYRIENTVPDSGIVTRGICEADASGHLTSIVERKMVEKTADGAHFSEDGGKTWHDIPTGTLVSMNFWGLCEEFIEESERDFPKFLDENIPSNPMKCEYILPTEVGSLLLRGKAGVEVLESGEMWHGITYKEDRTSVMTAISEKHRLGIYPTPLWG